MIRLLITDDDPFIRESLKLLLELDPEISVVGTCTHGEEALKFIKENRNVDVLLADIRMPVCDGVETTRRVKAAFPEVYVLILTTFDDDKYVVEALKNGANGYILKNIPHYRIIDNIKAVYKGDLLIHPRIAKKLTELLPSINEPGKSLAEFGLNDVEMQIILKISEGLTNKEIAHQLSMSEGTIKNYISVILSKMNLRDRTQIAIYYWKNR